MRRREAVFHSLLPVCLIFLLVSSSSPFFSSHRNLNLSSQILLVIKIVPLQFCVLESFSISTICFLCLFDCRVVAENDFLHTLLNKVTTLRGDSGGQGTVLQLQALQSVSKCVSCVTSLANVSGSCMRWTVYAAVICGQIKWPFRITSSPPLSALWVRMKDIILTNSMRP